MKIFELYFHPKAKEDYIFDSFVFEPENFYEKKLGGLYLVGELKNAIPHSRFLDNLARIIKEGYYAFSAKSSEKALSESLKKANEFLSEEVKKNNVSWLGNLCFAALSLKDFGLTFTKTGGLKVLLLRNSQIMDIGKNLEPIDIDPYPLKIFLNLVTGKLLEKDKILIITKDVFGMFLREGILEKMAKAEYLDRKKLKDIIPYSVISQEKAVSGVCLVVIPEKEVSRGNKIKEIYEKKIKQFSLSFGLLPKIKSFKKFFSFQFLRKPKRAKKPKIKMKLPKIKIINKEKISSFYKSLRRAFPSFFGVFKNPAIRKNAIITLLLFLLMAIGFLLFH